MDDNLRELVLGVLTAGVTAALGWFLRTHLWRRRLRRTQRFFGLPPHSRCLLVVNNDPSVTERAVARHDVYALLELSALIKDCEAQADIVAHDAAEQGFGERTEFCLGGPVSNSRTAAHLKSLLPGVSVGTDPEPGPDRAAFTIGGETHRMEKGTSEHVLLARLTAGENGTQRPVFLFAGQTGITNQAAARYLARHHVRLARRHGHKGTFCLLLRVHNSEAYGPDMVELVADVTRAATAPPAAASGGGTRRGSARASG
ncbi:hypothetical protein [Streptomyces sp. JJ36]|uniref:hypothetical protein n=1 Tax=Streptomyces sp. JJ36 TaxID=2736645 RepID=UPI001F2104FF|nr:hypothetical protein [Streptomyces sp. JJ36]MCF6522911.1 hypothetical protein [Streptomyces sp. JJ36]